jgi:hypothetical protein
MLRFAADTAIIVQGEIHLKRSLESIDDTLRSNYKIKINRKKKQKLRFAPAILKILILTRMTTP